MKTNRKHGFTIVELVVVIAIIAVLAAVLIPTFASIIKKANDSAYLQERTNQKIEDLAEKVEKLNYFTWEDFEKKLADELAKVGSTNTAEIKEAVEEAMKEYATYSQASMTGLTADQVKKIVDEAMAGQLTTAQVEAIVKAAVGDKYDDVDAIVNAVVAKMPKATGITKTEMQSAIKQALAGLNISSITDADIEKALAAFGVSTLTKEDINGIISSATSDNTTLAKALNIRLANLGIGKQKTVYDMVVKIGGESVITGTNTTSTVSDSSSTLLYDLENNKFFTVKNNVVDYDGELSLSGALDEAYKYWTFSKGKSETYSTYLLRGSTLTSETVSTGIDVGYKTDVTSITYTNSVSAQDVVIRTNGGTLTIGSSTAVAEGKITHYGTLDEAIIYTSNNSFHTHGKIASMDLRAGKAVAEDKGYVALVKAAEGTEIQEVDTGIFYIPSNAVVAEIDTNVAASIGYVSNGAETPSYVIDTESEKGQERTQALASTAYEINDKYDLIAFRDTVNAGNTFAGITVKLNADIDLDGVDWTPIGQYKDLDGKDVKVKFSGTFDGQNHVIDNMHIIALSSENTYKSSYRALFGYTNGIIKNFTIKGSIVGVDCAGVVAALDAGGQILNVNSYVTLTGQIGKKGGSIEEYQEYLQGKTGGICVTVKGNGTWIIENCNNYGNVSSGKDGAGGIIGWTNGTGGNLTTTGLFIKNCNNYGAITSTGNGVSAGGISGNAGGKFYAENCTNEGAINGSKAGGIFGNCGSGTTLKNCENKGTISGGETGGIGAYAYDVSFNDLRNSGTINGTSTKGEIFAQVDQSNIDANEFTFNRNTYAIGLYVSKESNTTRYIDHADDDTVGAIRYSITANTNSTVEIRNSTITTLNVNPMDNHSSTLVLDNSTIGTVNLNKNVTGMYFGFAMYIQEKSNTTNSLNAVNLYGTLKSGYYGDQIHMHFGIACSFNRTNEASSQYNLNDVTANEGYSISGPVSNVWTIAKTNN